MVLRGWHVWIIPRTHFHTITESPHGSAPHTPQVTWAPLLGALSVLFDEYNDARLVRLCLQGFAAVCSLTAQVRGRKGCQGPGLVARLLVVRLCTCDLNPRHFAWLAGGSAPVRLVRLPATVASVRVAW